ncbi:GIY-YIG nuclease family protein [Novosphingobium subterraneum]|uniref:Bacteriophage T5 Orf172 DNA-binding domain-containing protein n=1 Tax=Novosphingobium subterraneum TaxID=48936 RepID=A0A0B8Z5U9_9SPHN|nr:GIY-YIG nuclease family protein [Novosphingobium subterraneum]KHS41593.1 hypothetical protein NJ75_04647 [Novosphingobium subterraneum]
MSEGFVYILTNEAMPGFVKIGLTQQDDVADRVKQLDTTSVPMPFEVHFAARVPDCRKLERTLHFVFGENRTRKNREFFKINPDLAKAIIELVAIAPVEYSDEEQDIDAKERAEIEQTRTRREVRTFKSLNVPVGAQLTFTKDDAITCTVVSDRKVLFEGQIMSATAAALAVVRQMGYDWKTVNGMEYWAYKGVKLSSLGEGQPDFEADEEADSAIMPSGPGPGSGVLP